MICLVIWGSHSIAPSQKPAQIGSNPTPATTRKLASDKARCLLASDINVSRASSVMIIFFLGAACFLVFDAIDDPALPPARPPCSRSLDDVCIPNIDDLAIVKSLSREAAACGREDRHRTGAITRSG